MVMLFLGLTLSSNCLRRLGQESCSCYTLLLFLLFKWFIIFFLVVWFKIQFRLFAGFFIGQKLGIIIQSWCYFLKWQCQLLSNFLNWCKGSSIFFQHMLMVEGGLPRMLLIFLHTEEAFVLIERASTYDCHSFFFFPERLLLLLLQPSSIWSYLRYFQLCWIFWSISLWISTPHCTLCSTMVWGQIVSSGTWGCACSSAHLECHIILQHIAQDHSPRLQVLVAISSLQWSPSTFLYGDYNHPASCSGLIYSLIYSFYPLWFGIRIQPTFALVCVVRVD